MAATLSPDNSIAWAQVHLRGGWRNLLITGGAYAFLVGGGIFVTTHLATGPSPSSVYGGWLPGLLGLQMAVLLLFGTTRVTAAIRQDHASRMIESHRLMPVGGGQAVVGYLVGATSQATLLALVNVLLGVVVANGAGVPFTSWIIVNLVLFGFCAFIWVLAAFCAFLVRMPGLLLVSPLLLVWLSGGMIVSAVPALTVLNSPLVGSTIFQFRASATEFTPARAVSMLSQAFIAAVCFLGASRRFRRGDWPALTPLLGLLLLGGWVAISCAGTAWWDDFRPRFVPGHWLSTELQLVGSLLSAMLLALIPVASLARSERDWRQRAPDDPRPARPPLPGAALAAVATLITVAMVWVEAAGYGADDENGWARNRSLRYGSLLPLLDPTVRTAAVVFLFLLAAGYLLQILARFGIRPIALFIIFLVLTWVGPLIGDVVRYTIEDDRSGSMLGTVSSLGPPGALIQLWVRPSDLEQSAPTDTTLGIAVQAAVAGVLGLVYYRTRRGKMTR